MSLAYDKQVMMINGYGVPDESFQEEAKMHKELLQYYIDKSHAVKGDAKNGFKMIEISVAPNVQAARIDISAHGKICLFEENNIVPIFDIYKHHHDMKLIHQLRCDGDGWENTADVIGNIVNKNEGFFEVHLWSCHAGACTVSYQDSLRYEDVIEPSYETVVNQLPRGSIFVAHGPVLVDAWSQNLYKAQLASIKVHDEWHEAHHDNAVLITLPSDAIECLSIGVKYSDDGVKLFNLHTIPLSNNHNDIMTHLNSWMEIVDKAAVQLGIKLRVALEFGGNNNTLEEFIQSMYVTYIRSDLEGCIIALSKVDGQIQESIESGFLKPNVWDDIGFGIREAIGAKNLSPSVHKICARLVDEYNRNNVVSQYSDDDISISSLGGDSFV